MTSSEMATPAESVGMAGGAPAARTVRRLNPGMERAGAAAPVIIVDVETSKRSPSGLALIRTSSVVIL